MTDVERLSRACVCPKCRGSLAPKEDRLSCTGCGRLYPVVCGIGVFVDELDAADQRKAEFLAKRYSKLPYQDLLEAFDSEPRSRWGPSSTAPEHVERRWRDYVARVHERGREEIERCKRALARANGGTHWPAGSAIEIGSGRGSGLPALAESFEEVVALEPSLSDLILARKACESKGLKGIVYVCAVAEEIPFPDNRFDFAIATAVIEHLHDQPKGVSEIARVLKIDGIFFGNGTNRYNLLLPEEHVCVRFVGFVPRRWASLYTKLVGKIEYDGIRPPSYLELRGWLRAAFKGGRSAVGVRIPRRTGKWAKLAPIVDLLNKLPLARQAAGFFGPNLDFLCIKGLPTEAAQPVPQPGAGRLRVPEPVLDKARVGALRS
jgi:ubiquinone/menaquinone biosynthesis C-methylase UbiE/uncharacterized protein YbaR (Trm112 family)